MAMRLHEVHPSLVHFPLALVPTALALDALGHVTDNAALSRVGQCLMPIAAGSAVITAAAGYAAQAAVRAEGEAHEMLATHRNLNTGLVALTSAMAIARMSRERVGAVYWLLGLAGVATMGYTAYLGGKMVYSHRVGVEPDGVDVDASPEIRPGAFGKTARKAARNVRGQVGRPHPTRVEQEVQYPASHGHDQDSEPPLSHPRSASPSASH
ncbi:DUF2231 domain-containing protein [Steroidobacter sp. S1-65]|uniref:DUF2231 domain-containing protein n=1 Tax=Steroidobacter gossypii TaxID=2805490 RepID=A0ABS1WY87_9GAMM|nr:DUF2231 domain-containing protein [Steroidobacter gossypii]MBM0105933.1 DUF2231 domain-containing protein [Steroidobacter gossypii]